MQKYERIYNEYVAKLFGEVNVFSDEEKKLWNLAKTFWFPHEIKISVSENQQQLNAKVLESRFAGNHFWNKISWNDKKLVVYTNHELVGDVNIEFI